LFNKQFKLLKVLGEKGMLFSIGGSNDQSYPNVRALMEIYSNAKIGVVNLDQHFDVRPLKEGKAHSGSPFRQML
jgi:formiminoglutamase